MTDKEVQKSLATYRAQCNARDRKEAEVRKLMEGGMPEDIARRIVAERGKLD